MSVRNDVSLCKFSNTALAVTCRSIDNTSPIFHHRFQKDDMEFLKAHKIPASVAFS